MTELGLIIFVVIAAFFAGVVLSAAIDEKKKKYEQMKLRALQEALESERKKVETLRVLISKMREGIHEKI